MAGVDRRDGLREAVAALRDLMVDRGHGSCLRINCATCASNDFAWRLTHILDAVPDVPPDPPAAEVSE